MRKRLALVAASAVAAAGVGLAIAAPASAETFGYYSTQSQCETAKAAHHGVNSRGEALTCGWSPGDDGLGGWLLSDGRGGG